MNTMTKGATSTALGSIGVVFLVIGYSLFDISTPTNNMIIGLFFFTAIALIIMSIAYTITALVKKEQGPWKYIGLIISTLPLTYGILWIILMMLPIT